MAKTAVRRSVNVVDKTSDEVNRILSRVAAEMGLKIENRDWIYSLAPKTKECGHKLDGFFSRHCETRVAIPIAMIDETDDGQLVGFSVGAADKSKMINFARKVSAKLKTKLTVTIVEPGELEDLLPSYYCPNASEHLYVSNTIQ